MKHLRLSDLSEMIHEWVDATLGTVIAGEDHHFVVRPSSFL